ncbi:MAG: tRNA uridine-5-carboxymethylaminomethyl(34) synthesis GTPase MnmE [Gemmatimonadaceae bacterium]
MSGEAEDTIAAIATSVGKAAIAVIRISGESAFAIASKRVTPWPTQVRQATLCTVRDERGDVLDEALVTRFVAPASFTGEDVVEIATHGGVVVPVLVLAALLGAGARQALQGEFTRRAVLNGKLDIVQAEAVGDLIDASSRAMQRSAIAQLDGGLSHRIDELRDEVIALEAMIAYDIDFPEEDDGPIPADRVHAATSKLIASLTALLDTAPAGELVRSGALVVIAGAPNAGKSSLFNAMLGTARAIVTEIAGTTRDAIEAVLDVSPWPLRLVDTAGLRETSDIVEKLGIDVATRYLESADVVLACGDNAADVAATAGIVSKLTNAPVLEVRTKSDLDGAQRGGSVSAVTGEGMRELLETISQTISNRYGGVPQDAPVLTRTRQRYSVEKARDEVQAFAVAFGDGGLPASVAAVHLRTAANALSDVTGAIDVEDVLDSLFRTFCVGK